MGSIRERAFDPHGVWCALVTPMRDGVVDGAALARHVDELIAEGVHGVVALGSTGEAPTLDDSERELITHTVIRAARGRVPVFVGIGVSDTRRAVAHAHAAAAAGADGLLVSSPPYNKPTQAGLYGHFRAVHDACELPIMLYNIPGRTGVNVLPDTVARLAELPCVVGIKEATGDLKQWQELLRVLGAGTPSGTKIRVLAGDDDYLLPVLALGGDGAVSAVANALAPLMLALYDAWRRGDPAEARRLHFKGLQCFTGFFIEPNPVPVKAVLANLGRMAPDVRPPLTPIGTASLEKLLHWCREAGLPVTINGTALDSVRGEQ